MTTEYVAQRGSFEFKNVEVDGKAYRVMSRAGVATQVDVSVKFRRHDGHYWRTLWHSMKVDQRQSTSVRAAIKVAMGSAADGSLGVAS